MQRNTSNVLRVFAFDLEECTNRDDAGRAMRSLTGFVSATVGFHDCRNDHIEDKINDARDGVAH